MAISLALLKPSATADDFTSRLQSVAFRATYLRVIVVCYANPCRYQMIVIENKFYDNICQRQQSSIATLILQSPLNCCDRSSSGLGKMSVVG